MNRMNSIEFFRNYNDGNVDIKSLDGERKEKSRQKLFLMGIEPGTSWVPISFISI